MLFFILVLVLYQYSVPTTCMYYNCTDMVNGAWHACGKQLPEQLYSYKLRIFIAGVQPVYYIVYAWADIFPTFCEL